METGQAALIQGDLVVETDQFQEHAGNQHDQISGIGVLILNGQNLDLDLGRSAAFGLRGLRILRRRRIGRVMVGRAGALV